MLAKVRSYISIRASKIHPFNHRQQAQIFQIKLYITMISKYTCRFGILLAGRKINPCQTIFFQELLVLFWFMTYQIRYLKLKQDLFQKDGLILGQNCRKRGTKQRSYFGWQYKTKPAQINHEIERSTVKRWIQFCKPTENIVQVQKIKLKQITVSLQ